MQKQISRMQLYSLAGTERQQELFIYVCHNVTNIFEAIFILVTRSPAVAEIPRDALCYVKSGIAGHSRSLEIAPMSRTDKFLLEFYTNFVSILYAS